MRTVTDAAGRTRYVRMAFSPRNHRVPDGYIEELRANNKGYGSRELLGEYGGPWHGFNRPRTSTRNGKQYVVLLSASEWAIEVELTDRELGEMRALEPEETWQLLREYDAKGTPPVEVEGESEKQT